MVDNIKYILCWSGFHHFYHSTIELKFSRSHHESHPVHSDNYHRKRGEKYKDGLGSGGHLTEQYLENIFFINQYSVLCYHYLARSYRPPVVDEVHQSEGHCEETEENVRNSHAGNHHIPGGPQ